MMFWWGQGMSGWGFALMSVSLVLFWGVAILGIVALVRYLSRSSPPDTRADARRQADEKASEDLHTSENNTS